MVIIISIQCNDKSLNEIGLINFITKQMYFFCVFSENYDLFFTH